MGEPFEFGALFEVVPLEGQSVYTIPGGIQVYTSIFPPAIALGMNVPPFTILINVTDAIALAEVLIELAAEV